MVKVLEDEPRDVLHQSSAGVIGVGRIPISLRHLHECQAGRSDELVVIGIEEIDIVEGIQELSSQLKVVTLADPDLLLDAQIEADELRSCDEDVLRGALAGVELKAVCATGRRQVTSGGNAKVAVTGRRGRVGVESPDRIVEDVLRQDVNNSRLIIEAQLELLAQVLHRHADQIYTAEIE